MFHENDKRALTIPTLTKQKSKKFDKAKNNKPKQRLDKKEHIPFDINIPIRESIYSYRKLVQLVASEKMTCQDFDIREIKLERFPKKWNKHVGNDVVRLIPHFINRNGDKKVTVLYRVASGFNKISRVLEVLEKNDTTPDVVNTTIQAYLYNDELLAKAYVGPNQKYGPIKASLDSAAERLARNPSMHVTDKRKKQTA